MNIFSRGLIFTAALTMISVIFIGQAPAYELLGTGNGSLIGGDITDPANRITAGSYAATAFSAATWVSATANTDANQFYGGTEGASTLFGNSLGGTNHKWCKSTSPAIVTLEFPSAFVLTHFTMSSSNHMVSNNRIPAEWIIEGFNETTQIWDTVYSHITAEQGNVFTTADQVALFTSFTNQTLAASGLNAVQQATVSGKINDDTMKDFDAKGAYSQYRLTVTNGGSTFEFGELELFGYTAQSYVKTSNAGGTPAFLAASAYNMDASKSVTADGDGNVSAWGDATGKTLSFAQGDTAKQPKISSVTTAAGTFDTIQFNEGVTAGTNNQTMTLAGTNATRTLFLVNLVDEYVSLGGIIGESGDFGIRLNNTTDSGFSGTLAGAFWRVNDANDFASGGYYYYNGGQAARMAATDSQSLSDLHLLSAVYNTSLSKLLDNNITLGNYQENRIFKGQIAEVLAFSEVLDEAEIKTVLTYLGTKYGLSMADGSTYKTGDFTGQQFFVGNTTNWDVTNDGAGGFGIATVANIAFDLFGTALPSLSDDTMLMVTADRDVGFGTMGTVIGSEDFTMWQKQWFIDVTNTSLADDALYLAFNAADALYNGVFDDTTDWNLLYSDDGNTFSVLSDTGTFSGDTLLFGLGLDNLETGYYSIGYNSTSATPEPAAWVLMALGVLAGWRVARRKKD